MKPKNQNDPASQRLAPHPDDSSPGSRSRVPFLSCLGPLLFPAHRWENDRVAKLPNPNSFDCDMNPEPHFVPASSLVSPSSDYRASYLSLTAEFRAKGEKGVPFVVDFPTDDFPAFLQGLRDCITGIGVPPGFVAHETFWLVDAGEVVGVSNLRPTLNDRLLREGGHIGYGIRPSARRRGHATRILALTIEKARERGIGDVLVTCNRGNIASARTILRNGGVLESEEFSPAAGDVKQRYWIRAS